MLDTAWRQLRYGVTLLSGRRVRPADLRHLVADMVATAREFGALDTTRMREMREAGISPDARQALDARRWRAIVRKAYAQVPYYRAELDRLGLDPGTVQSQDVPPTPKSVVRACPELFVARDAKPVFQAWTTGTTGTPTAFWFSRYELELATTFTAIGLMGDLGLGPQDVFQICISSRAALGLYNTMEACRMIGAACFLTGLPDPEVTLARLTTPVHLPGKVSRPSAISVHASYLAELVATAERLGYGPQDFGLRWIANGGEILSDALKARAARVFGAEVRDNYAMTETFPLSGEPCSQGHLHTAPDLGLVEVLDPTTWEPTAPGQVGMLVITPFAPYRETMPLLRLATGDMVRTLDEPAGCEMAGLPATSRLLGRGDGPVFQRDVLELLEGEPMVPLPCRYAIDGETLHVYAEERARGRLEAGAAALGIEKVVLYDDPAALPRIEFYRGLLRETSVVREEGSGTWSLR
ncbi:phenylacetate--CoA ligase family protein [Solihabitans fulvus]|uniref:Phenylacetate--CoA ligase family protein n=1 Tax=Solihabitans fulvus TaxID=1892852 RepID=A0A5B2XGZ6_9PSEU|nr:AMP-binding protein [Solihabitans fulvus]KAA2262673.1 phenylacetate--CoA ligase family protein [Solihabitans fulvus]